MNRFIFSLCLSVVIGWSLPVNGRVYTRNVPVQQVAACPTVPRPTPTPPPTPISEVPLSTPEQLLEAHYLAIMERRYSDVAALYSDYSISFFNLSRANLVADMIQNEFNGWRLLEYKLLKTDKLSQSRYLFTVAERSTDASGSINTRSIKLVALAENGGWKFNTINRQYGSLIEYRSLAVRAKTISGVTIQPLYLIRYVDAITFGFCLRNASNRAFLWTWTNPVSATFTFRTGVSCDLAGNVPPLSFEAQRTYPDAFSVISNCDVNDFPTRISLKGWYAATGMGLPADFGEGVTFTFDIP